ncbi:hypothetical protein [Pseudarthrobacter sp. NS4]|uniref:hypothetical protein n=1 Tax=Pseudarthrobacter sp. NS4 TaxID=2973976 RepID=UPI002162C0CE|nr:hypothetical protein [Pseudarthrobacter sp. NS4]
MVLRESHFAPTLDEADANGHSKKLQRRSQCRGRLYNLNSKLNIVVRVDLDHARAKVIAKGHITVHSVNALYVVAKRANSLRAGLDLELDVSHARVDEAALKMLQTSSETHHLPARIDPQQAPCTISVLAPRRQAAAATTRLAA